MNIDYDWLVEMNSLADKAENDHSILGTMTDEQLSYLVYWNWGYSGAIMAEVTRAAIKVLSARGVDYELLGEQMEELASQYY
jgi:hypothetical protein